MSDGRLTRGAVALLGAEFTHLSHETVNGSFSLAARAERQTRGRDLRVLGHPVLQEAPSRRVALRRDEIPPVLPDEPGAEEGHDLGLARQSPELGHAACYKDREDPESERELVDAKPKDVDPRTEPVAFHMQHEARLGGDGERSMRDSSDRHQPALRWLECGSAFSSS